MCVAQHSSCPLQLGVRQSSPAKDHGSGSQERVDSILSLKQWISEPGKEKCFSIYLHFRGIVLLLEDLIYMLVLPPLQASTFTFTSAPPRLENPQHLLDGAMDIQLL